MTVQIDPADEKAIAALGYSTQLTYDAIQRGVAIEIRAFKMLDRGTGTPYFTSTKELLAYLRSRHSA